MERTQIYLSTRQTDELDKRAREQGTTRSHLIREAVETYLTPEWDATAFKTALANVAGMWADRNDLDEIYASMRQADRDKLAGLYPELDQAETDAPDDHR